jgi:hypothetical protein
MKGSYVLFVLFVFLAGSFISYSQNNVISKDEDGFIYLRTADGGIMKLAANDDVDGDGITNELEVNGYYWDADSFKIKAWNGDVNQEYFITDPLQASTDQDPYSDYTEVSGVGLDVNVQPPDNHPLVAARPIISVKMKEYEVIPLATISDAKGGAQGSSFTNETTNSTTVGVEVTEGVEFGSVGFNTNVSVTGSYSETYSQTYSSTSSSEINWSNTRSTQPDKAARLELILYLENTGSAEALDIITTVNLKLGDKIIATFNLPMVDALNPGQISADFNVANANGGEITVTLDELKALQKRAPLTLEVNQVQANVETLDNNNNSVVKSWNNFSGDINAVSVDIIANIGSDPPKRHQVFAATNQYNPQYSLEELLSKIFNLENTNEGLFINGRKYPEEWYISSSSAQVISEWENAGRPENIMPLVMHKNTKIVLNSPGEDSNPVINLAGYSKLPGDESPYSRVMVSAVPNNFPISLVTAEVSYNGIVRIDTLKQNELGFYTNEVPFIGTPDGEGKVYVKNAKGDISESVISIPAIYKNAAEVKQYSSFIPNPGADYWIYYEGDENKPMLLYCMFFDSETGDSLNAPIEYLTFNNNSYMANSSVWSHDGRTNIYHFNKVRIDANTLQVNAKDTSFVDVELLTGSYQPIFYQFDNGLYGKILYNPAFDTLYSNINLSQTPFYLSPDTKFTDGAEEVFKVSRDRKNVDLYVIPEIDYVLEGPSGIVDSLIQLEYGNFTAGITTNQIPGNALRLNTASDDGFVNVGDSESLILDDQYTIEAWIYPTGPGTDTLHGGIIINKEGEYEIARFPDGSIRYSIGEGLSWSWKNTGYIAKDSVWTHIALVGNESARNLTALYIHDQSGSQFKGFLNSDHIGDVFTDMNDFKIGSRQQFENQKFRGWIDELRIWNRVRSSEQIESTLGDVLSSEYYSTLDSGLIGYWRFDELEDLGVGLPGTNDVRDFSVNGNHGDLIGDAQLTDLPVKVEDKKGIMPDQFLLSQNYPNPFNPTTNFEFRIADFGFVSLKVYDVLGREVITLVNEEKAPGSYKITFDATGLSSGVYIYRLEATPNGGQAGNFVSTKKMILMK